MAQAVQKPSHYSIRSANHKFQSLAYAQWQRSKQKTKPSALPPVQQANSHKRSKMKTLTNVQPALHSMPALPRPNQQRYSRGKVDPAETQARARLMRALIKNRRSALQELCHHQKFLTQHNQRLVRAVRDLEDAAARTVRTTLQQQETLSTVIDILEYSNKKKLQQFKCELQEWEEKAASRVSQLEQQLEQLKAKIQKTQEEVNFLSTYMDHEYPVTSVQIATLMRQLQQMKDSQQDELDELNEMRSTVLAYLSKQIQEKQKNLLMSLVVKTQAPHEKTLLQKTRDTQRLRKYLEKFREFVGQYEAEIPLLRKEVKQLHAQILDPREVLFADVLLRRPKKLSGP
ncbi:PREDICTED: uncharacterized protein C20orf96 homolog isoform X2 [Condylura cristata]|uniref:uncharacterized protein C20orf96 homolog isoform X2 n=1 Tax=Condylura cristata TaxID=143302 RepID=UPI00064295C0|nr:PREDICTED: uncharacterized protein C20orf96 homolog isoform X2 [Condylura cristata]